MAQLKIKVKNSKDVDLPNESGIIDPRLSSFTERATLKKKKVK